MVYGIKRTSRGPLVGMLGECVADDLLQQAMDVDCGVVDRREAVARKSVERSHKALSLTRRGGVAESTPNSVLGIALD